MAGSAENWKKKILFSREKNYWQQAVTRKETSLGILSGLAISLVIVYIFYDTPKALPVLAVLMPCWMHWWWSQRQLRKKEMFVIQLQEALRILASILETGRSLENAMIGVHEEMVREGKEETLIGKEFGRMRQQLSVSLTAEQVWQAFAARCNHPDVIELALVISAGKRAGGNLISVMKTSALQIAEKMEVDREIDTLLASKKTELYIMLAMPIGILLYMRIVFGDMIGHLYQNAIGALVMSAALVLYIVAAFWGLRIIHIDV